MKLPSLSFFKKAVPKEYFLALLLQDEMLEAIVFEETAGTIHIIGQGQQNLPTPLDGISFEELLAASDKAISTAENSLPNNVQSHKTIFGVKEDWTEDLQIRKDHLGTLKKLCDELDLQPIGFLVFAEAIAHLLQKEEGAPVSAVLVELGAHTITATLLRAGRVITSHKAPAEDALPKDVDKLLGAFTDVEILPSRIILLDTQKRPQILKQFTNHTWSKQLPFLHIPQVTPLPEGFEIQAILFGTATQMGFDVLGIPDIQEKTNIQNQEVRNEDRTEQTQQNEDEEQTPIIASETRSNAKEEIATDSSSPRNDEEEETLESSTDSSVISENFGFVKDKDVLDTSPKKPIAFDNLRTPGDETTDEFAQETFADIPEEVKEEEEGLHSRLPGLGVNGVQITEGMQKIVARIRKLPLSSLFSPLTRLPGMLEETVNGGSSRKLLFLIPLILLLCIGAIVWDIFGVHAHATLIMNPKIVEKTQGVTFSSTAGTDISSDVIGGTSTPISESGSSTTQTTGTQDVGDKAKGTVTIYNNDSSSHTISSGTTITSSNGLAFTTDTDITVASASGDIFSGTKPGTQNVNVTASSIGTEYNLPSGTKFSLGSSTVLAAMNSTAFSGGTKKTVTVVSQKDLDTVTAALTKSLGDKAKEDAKSNGNTTVLDTFLSTTMSNQKFDHKVGDQTSSVTLAGTITYQALSYNKTDLDKVALAIMQNNYPGEDISANNVTETVTSPTVSDDGKSITATLDVKAGILPKIDTNAIAQKLAGKSFSQAFATLSDISQLASVQSQLSPNLFFLPKTFPRIASHISISISANE